MQILSQSSQLWVSSKRKVEYATNARAVANFIGDELKKALPPLDRTATNSLQLVINPATLSTTYLNRDSIFWQAPVSRNLAAGDIAEVGYFVKWITDSSGRPKAVLCRFYAEAFDNASVANPHFLIYDDPANWITDSELDAVAPADQANSYAGLFAENVLGLWLSPLDSSGNSVDNSGTFDSRTDQYTDDNGTPADATDDVSRIFPRWIEISIMTVDSAVAARIDTAMQNQIMTLVANSATAEECRDSAVAASGLTAIRSGLRIYSTRIFLDNS